MADKGPPSQSCFSSSHVWMRELDHKEGWALNNWCFWTVVLEKTLECPLGYKEIKPINSEGNQPWIFIRRTDAEAETPTLCPPDVKNWLIGKDPDPEKDWRQEGKRATEDEMVGWHHWLAGHELEEAPGAGDIQGSLACCSSRCHRVGHDWVTELTNWWCRNPIAVKWQCSNTSFAIRILVCVINLLFSKSLSDKRDMYLLMHSYVPNTWTNQFY